jgi:hypothetical protein
MWALVIVFGLTVTVSLIARLLGASKMLAVLVALLPAGVVEFLFVTSGVIMRDSHGDRIPTWQMVFGGMVIPVALAVAVIAVVGKKTAIGTKPQDIS